MNFILRGMYQAESAEGVIKRSCDAPESAFEELLTVKNYPVPDPVLTWDDIDRIAALDVDMWPGERVGNSFGWSIRGCGDEPEFSWVTHGGGYRGIFFGKPPLTAAERAALFAFLFVRRQNLAYKRIEIKRETRHPFYPRSRDGGRCGRVKRGTPPLDGALRAAAIVLGDDESVTDEQITKYMEKNDLTLGRRYDHDRCPIAPSKRGHGQPVVVLDKGIYCHYCKANGPRCFIPFVQLIDPDKRQRRRNPIKLCASGMAHWEHARRVIEAETEHSGEHAELLYRALLKVTHLKPDLGEKRDAGMRRLIDSCFVPKASILRGRGCWFLEDLATHCGQSGLKKVLATLPAAKYVDEKGDIKTAGRTLGMLEMGGDVSGYGYPALVPVRGVDYGWRKRVNIIASPVSSGSSVTVQCVIPANPPFGSHGCWTGELEWAEQRIEKNFPGVRLDLLRLLIAGKGVSQLDPSDPPLVMIHGQSEAAKTAHVLLAAELCCDRVTKIPLGSEAEFLREVAHGADAGVFVFIDEIAKQSKESPLPGRLLSIARGRTYRELYVGPRPLPPLPVIVMADTVVPEPMRNEVQLARRIVDVDLGCGIAATGANWRETCGTGDIMGWRAASAENTKAADTFTYGVIQDYADSDFLQIAGRLEFRTFRDAEGDIDMNEEKRAFFNAVCQAPDANKSWARGRGYKLLKGTGSSDPVMQAYEGLLEFHGANVGEPFGDTSIQAVTGEQWGRVLGIPGVECDIQRRGRQAVVRFRLGSSGAAGTRINGEIGPVAT